MASLSRSFSYRRSFNSHHRAARDSKHVNSQKFHENIKELKQLRRRVKKVMWEWMDSKSRERVDSEFRDALSSICHITSYFEEILDITSARTQRLLNEVEKCYQDDIKTKRRENENKLRGLKDRVMQLEKSLEDSQSDNKQLSDRCEGYRRQNERLQQQMTIQQNEETEKLNSLSEEIQKLKANLKENDETISRLDIQQQSVEEENRNLKQELKKNEDNFEKSLSKLQEENKTLRNELQSLRNEQIKRDEMLAAQLQKKENVIHQIQNQKADLDKRNCRFLEEKENLCITIDKLQQHLAAEKHAKEDALTRLSAAAANRLRDNNPGIADLGDPNRPMKLAERLSELYDNDWTNAMEAMEDHGIEEEEGVQILLNILTNVFTLCKDGGNKVMSAIENFIAIPAIDGLDLSQIKIDSLPKFQSEMLKPLKDYRKYNGEKVIPVIKEVIIEKLKETPVGKKDHVMVDCEEYIDKAIEYCWMMRVQDPPVHIEWDFPVGSDFDSNRFRSYTKGGNYVSFVVWPVLYLHENGPLLAKGVVQGKKNK